VGGPKVTWMRALEGNSGQKRPLFPYTEVLSLMWNDTGPIIHGMPGS